jgi:hypothetical protein
MNVSDVTEDEMKACGDLLQFMKVADLTVKMSQAGLLFNAVSWLQALAKQMILSKTEKPVEPTTGIKIHRAKK